MNLEVSTNGGSTWLPSVSNPNATGTSLTCQYSTASLAAGSLWRITANNAAITTPITVPESGTML